MLWPLLYLEDFSSSSPSLSSFRHLGNELIRLLFSVRHVLMQFIYILHERGSKFGNFVPCYSIKDSLLAIFIGLAGPTSLTLYGKNYSHYQASLNVLNLTK